MCVLIFSTNVSETFLILKRTERDMIIKVKVNNRPDVAQRVPGGLGSQIFMIFGT